MDTYQLARVICHSTIRTAPVAVVLGTGNGVSLGSIGLPIARQLDPSRGLLIATQTDRKPLAAKKLQRQPDLIDYLIKHCPGAGKQRRHRRTLAIAKTVARSSYAGVASLTGGTGFYSAYRWGRFFKFTAFRDRIPRGGVLFSERFLYGMPLEDYPRGEYLLLEPPFLKPIGEPYGN